MRTLLAAATIVACTGTASAGLFFVDLTLNNPSIDPWIAVEFRIVPVEGFDYGDDGIFEHVRFSNDITAFGTTKSFSDIIREGDDIVRYEFASFAPMMTGDSETFTLALEIEQFVPFKIQQFFTPVPTPGTGVLAAAALAVGLAARRRRNA